MKIEVYLTFNGNCEEALNFYATALQGEITHLQRFEDTMPVAGNWKSKVLHSNLTLADGTQIMASDSMGADQPVVSGTNFSISLDFETPEHLEKVFQALAKGGTITMPLQNTFWNARFGMLTDQYGVRWMFNCALDTPKPE